MRGTVAKKLRQDAKTITGDTELRGKHDVTYLGDKTVTDRSAAPPTKRTVAVYQNTLREGTARHFYQMAKKIYKSVAGKRSLLGV